jgi:hypothetical protein
MARLQAVESWQTLAINPGILEGAEVPIRKLVSGPVYSEIVMFKRLCLTFALMLAASSVALAQSPYRPVAGPTLPRQLDYFRRDVGVLDPYNTFVAPRKRLDQDLRRLQAQEQADAAQAKKAIAGVRASLAAPTGSGATFMNYSHYYSRSGPVRSRQVR